MTCNNKLLLPKNIFFYFFFLKKMAPPHFLFFNKNNFHVLKMLFRLIPGPWDPTRAQDLENQGSGKIAKI